MPELIGEEERVAEARTCIGNVGIVHLVLMVDGGWGCLARVEPVPDFSERDIVVFDKGCSIVVISQWRMVVPPIMLVHAALDSNDGSSY